MNKWIAEFDLEDGDKMPEHMDLEYKGAKIDFHCRPLEQEPTIKNDLAQERYQDLIEYFGDEKVAKTILESRKEFKAWLERLRWNVKRVDKLDRELEQIKGTNKHDLGVDCVSKQAVIYTIYDNKSDFKNDFAQGFFVDKIRELPSVTSLEPFTWIVGKNNAQIAVKNMPIDKLQKICAIIGDEQEPILDKIRAEIEQEIIPRNSDQYDHEAKWQNLGLRMALMVIDKYKAEIEPQEGSDKE